MAGYLTTHVLDTTRGRPAAGLTVELYRIDGASRDLVTAMTTNEDGRTDGPILPAEHFVQGIYELVFKAGDYLKSAGLADGSPFLDEIPIRFTMAEQSHYHVPLLLSPYSYATYRGS